ncbi:MAG TPA: hypothetical protein VFR87_20465 [Nocardioidaceae bacterium]|nr:hypothetical protein [Nocardioidaceae bacterium]
MPSSGATSSSGNRHSPPEDSHALDVDRLVHLAISFHGLRVGGTRVAVGALKQLAPGHGEVRSMHTAQEGRALQPVGQDGER